MISPIPDSRKNQFTKWLESSHHTTRVVEVEAVAGRVDEEAEHDQRERDVRRRRVGSRRLTASHQIAGTSSIITG